MAVKGWTRPSRSIWMEEAGIQRGRLRPRMWGMGPKGPGRKRVHVRLPVFSAKPQICQARIPVLPGFSFSFRKGHTVHTRPI